MASKKPVRIMIAASVCVVASAGGQALAKSDDSTSALEREHHWQAISKAYAKGDLSILGTTGKPSIEGVEAQFRNIATPFGNN
jgi:hypothetical protein